MHETAPATTLNHGCGPVSHWRSALRLLRLLGALVMVLSIHACNDPQKPASPEPRPDFHLQDVNSNSARFSQVVSPRDYLGKVSAWYFGHAT
jgi:hypothetical protein